MEDGNRLTRSADGRQAYCRAGNAAWHAEHKAHHNRLILERNKRVREEIQRKLFHYKLERGCADCGERDPTVLQFDHLRDKVATVSLMVSRFHDWGRFLAELEKCDVTCGNCHLRRTARRAHDIRWRLFLEFRAQIEALG